MTAPRFDPASGEIVSDEPAPKRPDLRVVEDPEKVRLKAEIEILERQLSDAERDLRNKRARITALLNDKEQERQAYIRREEVELWFDVWKLATNHPNSKLGPKHFDAIKAMIELGYEIEQWDRVCWYVGQLPFWRNFGRHAAGSERERKDSPSYIYPRFEQLANEAWEMKRSAQGGNA
jgi:hypothetical protein